MHRTLALAVILVALPLAAEPPAEVKVTVIKYDGLTEAVKKLKGKVVVVDCWADFCVPCKREFPKLVELSKKQSKDGLVAMSVSVDELGDGVQDRVLKFLKAKNATFANYILDEKPELWQEKFKIDGPPMVMVFNRKGELAKKFTDKAVDYAEIEKLTTKLLKE